MGSPVLFLVLLATVLLSWVVVALWTEAIKAFAYKTLALNPDNSLHSFVVAFVPTLALVGLLVCTGESGRKLSSSMICASEPAILTPVAPIRPPVEAVPRSRSTTPSRAARRKKTA